MMLDQTNSNSSEPLSSAHDALLNLVYGHVNTQVVYVAAKLGIADLLKDEPKTSRELAEFIGVDMRALQLTLRSLVQLNVLIEDENGRLQLTPIGELLASGVPGSLHGRAIYLGEEHYRAWGDLLYSVETGQAAFNHAFGMSFWEYLSQNPETQERFHQFRAWRARLNAAEVLETYDFTSARTIVDVGGGYGTLIATILAATPHVTGILYELESVTVEARRHLEEAGVADRCQIITGNFFTSVPQGGDGYLLSRIIHDWSDGASIRILKNCRAAIQEYGHLWVIEIVMPEKLENSHGATVDLEMLVLHGGQERTKSEYSALFAAAGFELTKVVPTPSGLSIIEGVPIHQQVELAPPTVTP